jgi:hypothetical protein
MAKTVTGIHNGEIVTHKVTRHQKKSESRLIPWTKGPTTRTQRVIRNLIG